MWYNNKYCLYIGASMKMGINRVWIKDRSKQIVKASKPNILLIGLAYVVILYVIDLLCSYLSGYATVSEVVTGYARKGMVPTYEELMGLVFHGQRQCLLSLICLGVL